MSPETVARFRALDIELDEGYDMLASAYKANKDKIEAINKVGFNDDISQDEIIQAFKEISDDFGAGFINNEENPHAFAHGDIELRALTQGDLYSVKEVYNIYYGNWLRDFSQIIVGATIGLSHKDQLAFKTKLPKGKQTEQLLKKMNSKLTQDTWVKIIELLAIYEFTYQRDKKNLKDNFVVLKGKFDKEYGVLTKDVLGIYRPEEHIDNPKGLEDESIFASFMYEKTYNKQVKKTLYKGEKDISLTIKDKMKYYILNDVDEDRPSTFTYFSEQLRLAKAKGKNKDGFRHFGAALHILEDYFAHTNFIEISLIKQGFVSVHPWVEIDDATKKIKDGKIKASKIPLVTGLFSADDTIASITPKIAQQLFPLEIEKYKSRNEGERTFFDMLVKYVLEDLIEKEKNEKIKTTYLGLNYQDFLTLYNKYLSFLDKLAREEKKPYSGWFIKLIRQSSNFIGQILKLFTSVIFNLLLNSLDDAIKEEQTLMKGYGNNPSHTQLAKDPDNHPLNELAGLLAIEAVNDLGKQMLACWGGKVKIEIIISNAKTKYFNHPSNVEWMNVKIKEWIKDKANLKKIEKAESATIIEHAHKTLKKDLTKFNTVIKKVYDYFKKSTSK